MRQLSNWCKWASNFKNSLIKLFRLFKKPREINVEVIRNSAIWQFGNIWKSHSDLHVERLVFGLITDDLVPTLLEETRETYKVLIFW